jgi:hypothetical protein
MIYYKNFCKYHSVPPSTTTIKKIVISKNLNKLRIEGELPLFGKEYLQARHSGTTPVIPALWSLGQEDHEFEANLGYTVRSCLKASKQSNKQNS